MQLFWFELFDCKTKFLQVEKDVGNSGAFNFGHRDQWSLKLSMIKHVSLISSELAR